MFLRDVVFVGLKSIFVTCGKIPIILNVINKIPCKDCVFAILLNVYFSVTVACKSPDAV